MFSALTRLCYIASYTVLQLLDILRKLLRPMLSEAEILMATRAKCHDCRTAEDAAVNRILKDAARRKSPVTSTRRSIQYGELVMSEVRRTQLGEFGSTEVHPNQI